MPLRKADTSETRRFEDGEDWLELRVALNKHEADLLLDMTQSYRVDAGALTGDPDADQRVELFGQSAGANRWLFGVLAVAWSYGKDKPTATDYDEFDEQSGAWVDRCINEVLAERRRRAEGKARSSAKPSARRRKQPEGSGSA